MPIELPCPSCHQRLRVADQHAGRQARCPNCKTVFPVPDGPQATTAQGAVAAASDVRWYAKSTEGTQYGPIEKSVLDTWVQEGRITADCQLLPTGSAQWKWASEVYPVLAGQVASQHAYAPPATGSGNPYVAPSVRSSAASTTGAFALPHRGGVVLTLGILGFVICPILGIFAWVMGQGDLNDMRNGRMDNTGYGMTMAGMVLGIVSVAFMAMGCCLFFVGAAAG